MPKDEAFITLIDLSWVTMNYITSDDAFNGKPTERLIACMRIVLPTGFGTHIYLPYGIYMSKFDLVHVSIPPEQNQRLVQYFHQKGGKLAALNHQKLLFLTQQYDDETLETIPIERFRIGSC